MLGYTSELLRYAKLAATDEDPTPEHLLVPCLQLLFNIAFSTGSAPQSWKTSLVTPIFKKGDATDAANYRPILVGKPLSRLYASILVQRLVHFTEQHDLRSQQWCGKPCWSGCSRSAASSAECLLGTLGVCPYDNGFCSRH